MDGQRPGQTQEDDPDDLAVPAAGGGRDRAAAAEELPRVTDAPVHSGFHSGSVFDCVSL